MANRITGRLQTPADESGVRKDIHLVTSADCVMVDDDTMLNDKIEYYETRFNNLDKYDEAYENINQTMVSYSERFTKIEEINDNNQDLLENVETKMEGYDTKFGEMTTSFDDMETKVNTLADTYACPIYISDTQPSTPCIWADTSITPE